jgi:hypothetical protein
MKTGSAHRTPVWAVVARWYRGCMTHAPEPGFTVPSADRPPTPDEERAAERAAEDVDLDTVAEHYQDAAKTGAEVRGEGQIEPD